MKHETLDKLNFEHVLDRLASCCACSLGKHLAKTILPSANEATVRQWLDLGREFHEAADELGPPPMGGVFDVRTEIHATAKPTPLEGDALARVSDTLQATSELCLWFHRLDAKFARLKSLGERITDYSALAREIREQIDARGQVLDHASSKLRSIRRTIEEAHDRINVTFDRILRQTTTVKMLQYAGTTFHNDRVVLPLRAEHRGRIAGIIHRSSDSGATLFVEPTEVVEINNTIISLKEEEKKEITRILRELSRLVHREATGILTTLQAIGLLDLNRAKWVYASHHQCTYPVVDANGQLDLIAARHPVLLDLFETHPDGHPHKEVMPIDIRIGIDFDAMVITGPNTGGKTVAIKTLGLLVLMAQSGLPIPVAEGSRLPVYRDVFVDIGDEQNLQQSLSTFSSHMSNQLAILRKSGRGSLVLIDELGAGTDPDEGAAIGRTVIEELLTLGAHVVVTTHLSALKAVAYTRPRVDNASVEFDVQTLRPTYRLLMGEPGNSNAIIIAERLGMNGRLVQQARHHLDDRNCALDKAIRGTLSSRRDAEEALKAARQAGLEADRARRGFEEKQIELQLEREAYEQWSRWLASLKGGEQVYVASFEKAGKLVRLQLHRQIAIVAVGAFEMEVPLTDIRAPDAARS